MSNGERTFTWTPTHVLPVRWRRGMQGRALDILTAAFGPLERLR